MTDKPKEHSDWGIYLLNGQRVSRGEYERAVEAKYGHCDFDIGTTVYVRETGDLLSIMSLDRETRTAQAVPLGCEDPAAWSAAPVFAWAELVRSDKIGRS